MDIKGLGAAIRQRRKIRGLTQEQLAQKAGLSTMSIRRYEQGERIIPDDVLRNIAAALNVSVADLLPEPTEEEKSAMANMIREIGLPHGGGTVAETRALIKRVAEIYGEKSALLLRLTSIMSEAGVDKVIEYTKSIFQEYMDESIPRAGKAPQKGGESTPPTREGENIDHVADAPQRPQEGEE